MIKINLLKPEKKEIGKEPIGMLPEIREKKKTPLASLIVLLAVIVAAALYYFQGQAIKEEQALLETAQQEKQELEYVLVALEKLEEQKAILERKINLINHLKARQEMPVRIMDELSKVIPGWVWLTETSYKEQEIEIKGRALSNNLIADFVYNLENSPHLSNVKIDAINQRTDQSNRFLEFTLKARYVLPPGVADTGEDKEGEQQ